MKEIDMTTESTELVTKEQLLGATKRRFVTVAIEGLGKVRLRSITEKEKSGLEVEFLNRKGQTDVRRLEEMRRRLLCLTIVDADGNTTMESDDVDALAEVDGRITTAIYVAAKEHCGFDTEDMEDVRKN